MIEDLWYKNTVIYSLDVETFMDSNGDGIGDFEGLMRRLDYLDSIGVDTIWLAPFYPSPNRDNGYDVSDFYGVDPRHGSNGDFVEFMHQANERGMKVIIDLVVNHSSDQHLWFQEACADPAAPHHDMDRQPESFAFGHEYSFSHNHRHKLGKAGFEVVFENETWAFGARLMLTIGLLK